MITDATSKPKPPARDWALFRYGVISEAVTPLEGQKISNILTRQAAQVHQLPDGTARRYNIATLRSWLDKYRHDGLDGLMPKDRSDKGQFRSIDEDTAEVICRHRVQNRRLSVKLFWEILHQDGVLPDGVQIKLATLHRFLKQRGLAKKTPGAAKARAKFEMPHANDQWIADFMHGPRVDIEGRRRRAILCAVIDDHSRVIVGARFSPTEEMNDILGVLRDGIATYGVPKRLYCDNGPAFIAKHLKEASARIGCTLLHSDPFDSPSRGKIERFNRTVRQRFLPRLPEDKILGLEELNDRFAGWLHDDYHLRRHGGIKMKPLDRLLISGETTQIKRLSAGEIDHAFMGRVVRVVRNDATVSVGNRFYEVPPEYIGARCDLRFPIGQPEDLILYRDDQPVTRIKEVDLADNARFHARRVRIGGLQNQEGGS
ncbi:MAG: DDE-type integrase/transposase/recombinase [Cycloclasticus sp.]|nr:DDE-type integrase/transposase/recombinase [Cycloclasticus sp.]